MASSVAARGRTPDGRRTSCAAVPLTQLLVPDLRYALYSLEPLRRLGSRSEVGGTVRFLASTAELMFQQTLLIKLPPRMQMQTFRRRSHRGLNFS
jgi:hypothetical protein